MVEVKSGQAEQFLAGLPAGIRTLLIYGPDTGLVRERADAACRAFLGGTSDPMAVQRFDSDELAADPARLADEAFAIAMFGGARVIRVRQAGARSILDALEPVLKTPPDETLVVIEAGELRKTAPLRKRCETAKSAAAIACYAEGERGVDRVIDEELGAAGLTISPEARGLLKLILGADRMASRAEIRKLRLFALGQKSVGIEDVRAIVGEAAAFAHDDVVDAVALGDLAGFERSYRRLGAAGTYAGTIAGAVLRHFQVLHRARAHIEAGAGVEAALGAIQPPLFFTRRPLVERQLRLWPLAMIEAALDRLDKGLADSRLYGAIVDTVVAEALTAVALRASQLARRR